MSEPRLQATDEHCLWTEDEDGIWSACAHNMFNFEEGSPADNGFIFCPYCGKKLAQESYHDREPPEPDGECYRGGEAASALAEEQARIQRELK